MVAWLTILGRTRVVKFGKGCLSCCCGGGTLKLYTAGITIATWTPSTSRYSRSLQRKSPIQPTDPADCLQIYTFCFFGWMLADLYIYHHDSYIYIYNIFTNIYNWKTYIQTVPHHNTKIKKPRETATCAIKTLK